MHVTTHACTCIRLYRPRPTSHPIKLHAFPPSPHLAHLLVVHIGKQECGHRGQLGVEVGSTALACHQAALRGGDKAGEGQGRARVRGRQRVTVGISLSGHHSTLTSADTHQAGQAPQHLEAHRHTPGRPGTVNTPGSTHTPGWPGPSSPQGPQTALDCFLCCFQPRPPVLRRARPHPSPLVQHHCH